MCIEAKPTFTMLDDSWTVGADSIWTEEDIISMAKVFGATVEFDYIQGKVYSEGKIIAEIN